MSDENQAIADDLTYKLIRFNPRRAARKVGAAEVEISDGDNEVRLWMTKRDVEKNILEFGDHKGLRDALNAYKAGKEFP